MDDYRKEDRAEPHLSEKTWSKNNWEDRAPSRTTRWLVILSVLLLGVAVAAFGYGYEQSTAMSDLTIQNQTLHSAMTQMHTQIDMLTAKLENISQAPAQADPNAAATTSASTNGSGKASAASRTQSGLKGVPLTRTAAQDRRIKQLQTDLDKQKEQLKQTQDDVASTRSDFDGKLGSTRDELNGNIAKTHEELVALAKRGERSFFEFDISKSKAFQRQGPIQVSLRKADTKHQSYDLVMLVDDHQLTKKKVNLYEPVWLHQTDQPQPLQLVVNRIDKDRIHGYVSAPKYRESELSSSNLPAQDFNSKPSSPSPTTTPSSNSSSIPATSSEEQTKPID